MMLKKYLLLPLFLCPLFVYGQVEFANDSISENNQADSSMLLPAVPDTLSVSWPNSLQHQITGLLRSDMFRTSQVGLMIYDLDADSVLYAHNAQQTMRPASTMKLITAITAADKLGGSFRFKTDLCYTGEIKGNVLYGNVYCVGGFDPKFNSDDMRAFVESLRKMGVDTICGNLYADKNMRDTVRWGEGWCWDDDNPSLSPLLISRKDKFMERFAKELNVDHIVYTGKILEGAKPQNAYCIISRYHTLDQILMKMLKESDNLYAEALFYQLAASSGNRPAKAEDARRLVMKLARRLGLNPSRYRIADGSGLSLYNYLSPELEVSFLKYAYRNSNVFQHIYPALPIAGVDGTLRRRMRGVFTSGNVYAKTGTLSGVSSLAGYCKASNGHNLCFAIMNQGLMHTNNGRAFQDRVCTILCAPH